MRRIERRGWLRGAGRQALLMHGEYSTELSSAAARHSEVKRERVAWSGRTGRLGGRCRRPPSPQPTAPSHSTQYHPLSSVRTDSPPCRLLLPPLRFPTSDSVCPLPEPKPRMPAALLLVDVQYDFLPPSGALAVQGGDEILPVVCRLVDEGDWALVVASQVRLPRPPSPHVLLSSPRLPDPHPHPARPRRISTPQPTSRSTRPTRSPPSPPRPSATRARGRARSRSCGPCTACRGRGGARSRRGSGRGWRGGGERERGARL